MVMGFEPPGTDLERTDARPGRACPVHYRYDPADLAGPPRIAPDTVYIVGGLYGNRPALAALLALADKESPRPTLVFNGDFNWLNVDSDAFEAVNREVLQHTALRGNVETEIAGEDAAAGCGCAYPQWVGDDEVERSNRILVRLRLTARRFPGLRARLAALPMHCVAEVGGVRVAIVHGDAHSLAGWGFSQQALAETSHRRTLAAEFTAARARVFASSHTCSPLLADCEAAEGRCVLANNGAAGMPNFRDTRYGVITRISVRPAPGPDVLYGTRLDGLYIDALPLHYDHVRWLAEFSRMWPEGSAAHASYFRRFVDGGPATLAQALCLRTPA